MGSGCGVSRVGVRIVFFFWVMPHALWGWAGLLKRGAYDFTIPRLGLQGCVIAT